MLCPLQRLQRLGNVLEECVTAELHVVAWCAHGQHLLQGLHWNFLWKAEWTHHLRSFHAHNVNSLSALWQRSMCLRVNDHVVDVVAKAATIA